MEYQDIFRRSEIKYLVTGQQREMLTRGIEDCMAHDKYPFSAIRSLYYDTPDKLLIRRSLEKPEYKEKLRLRSYCVPCGTDTVFVELKKKYYGVVYKRRTGMRYCDAVNYLAGTIPAPEECQITREIDYFRSYYSCLEPSVLITYSRESFCGISDQGLRLTFDENILWRGNDTALSSGTYGRPLLGGDEYLMEIKAGGAIPLWLARLLSKTGARRTSFSKYGNAYKEMLLKELISSRSYA